MRIGSVLAALLGSLAAAQEPPELAHWQQILAVEVPEKCRAIGESGSLRIDCGGSALLLEPADGDDPRKLALQHSLRAVATYAGCCHPLPRSWTSANVRACLAAAGNRLWAC